MGLVNFKIKFKILYLFFPSAFLACELGSKSVLKCDVCVSCFSLGWRTLSSAFVEIVNQ